METNQQQNNDFYTESDYKELQRNLILYKKGNAEAVTYICQAFHQFLTKYTKFITYGILPHTPFIDKNGNERFKVDSSVSSFVSLFIDKKATEGMTRSKAFSATCTKIQTLFSKYEYDDIYNELVLALLNMANKYKITKPGEKFHKENGTFHMYVSKCFHWEAYKFLKKLVHDPLAHYEVIQLCDQFDKLEFDDDQDFNEQALVPDEKAEFAYEEMLATASRQNDIKNADTLTLREDEELSAYDLDSLNFNWTNGVTCSNLFKDLTPYEREIVILYYIKNKTDDEISSIYNMHRVTISNHRRKAVNKIKQKALKSNILNRR